MSPTPTPGTPFDQSAASRARVRRAVSIFNARVGELDTPLARLTARLGDRHNLTMAYQFVAYGFELAAFCHGHAPRADSLHPAPDPLTMQAIRYFNATAAHIVGSSLDQPKSANAPSRKDITDLGAQQAKASIPHHCL